MAIKFTPTAPKDAVKIAFEEGSLTKFTGTKLSIGYGSVKPLPQRKFVVLMRKVVTLSKQNKIKKISIDFKDIRALAPATLNDQDIGKIAGCAFVMANYEHTTYKTPPKDGFASVDIVAVNDVTSKIKSGFSMGQQIADAVNTCRELANTPGGDMTPKLLAQAAKNAVKDTTALVKILGRADMESLGMGAILGIAKGSAEEPQFIVVEYWGAEKDIKPIVLVGKGVTFDTGGLNIKTGDNMYEMHMDMSGGAAVINAVALAAKLKIKANVIALVPAVENAPGQTAVRPGDILKSMSGKTIEVLNTDAEGRVILADALTYAKQYNPEVVVDVATLTGAALVVLGQVASAFMTNEKGLSIADVMALGEASGDYLWPMPLWDEYEDMTKGTFGDVPNLSTMGSSRYGGVIAGGMFLWKFAKDLDCNWIHVDMAPRMTTIPQDSLAKGAAGEPVRFLFELIQKYAVK